MLVVKTNKEVSMRCIAGSRRESASSSGNARRSTSGSVSLQFKVHQEISWKFATKSVFCFMIGHYPSHCAQGEHTASHIRLADVY